ncbi:MAG TPA: GNAT family N-acetyltransferase [Anaerolineae bacterium]|nr:GNAT family N-acetyltransferase [Anaerolineae bacterium]
MDITFSSDIATFRRRASPLLESHCAVNSLKLGILEYCCEHREGTDNQVFALGIERGEVVAVFAQTRSLYFYAREARIDEAIHCAVEAFVKRQIAIPRVMGYGDTALRFAESWKRQTHSDVLFAGKDYLYEITSVPCARPTSGALRRAVQEDMHELVPLFGEYFREDLGITRTDQDLEQDIVRVLAEDQVYLWDDGGAKSMVTAMLPYDAGVELANVATLRGHRRMGYATACVGEVCRILLALYPRIVLFADVDNAPANSLYTKIGFRLVDEMNSYELSARTQGQN